MQPIRVTVWNENIHEREDADVRAVYPNGIHGCLALALRAAGCSVRTATQEQPDHGLADAVLADTDVLFWWGHCGHGDVQDDVVEKVRQHVLAGMGFVALHSAHYSKPFIRLMGTNCSLRWRDEGEKERIFVIEPSHPLASGLPDTFTLPHEEMYGERFDVPTPDETVMLGWFEGGDVFRSCCTWRRGHGRVVYFQPGHETYPTYHDANIQKVVVNAAHWAAQPLRRATNKSPNAKAFEAIRSAVKV